MSENQLNSEFEGTHNSAVHSSGDYCVNVAVNHGTINYVVQQIRQERFKALKQLPRDILNFVGRSEQLTEVEGVLRQGNGATIAISALSGMGGVGKSALAIRVAHRLKDDYPDAQLYVNLQGADRINCRDPFSVLGELLVELGLDEKLVVTMNLESRSKWWRSLLAELRAIVVLDNARDAAQVWQLLPGSDGPCAVIVTSRQELALDNVARLRLAAMTIEDARMLLSVMSERSFDAVELEVAAKVVEYCGRLPLAIKIVGALLRKRSQMSLGEAIEALKVERNRLTAFAKQHQVLQTDEYLDVRSSLNLSLKWLTEEERSIFEKVAVIPGVDFGLQVAEFVTDLETVQEGLDRLADEQLLEVKGAGRYEFHDLVRLLGREQWEKEEDWLALEARAIDWYFESTKDAERGLEGESIVLAVSWFKQEWQNLKAVVMTAAERSISSVMMKMPNVMLEYSLDREHSSEIAILLEISLTEAKRLNHRQDEATSLDNLGVAYRSLSQYQHAIDFHQKSLEIKREIGDRNGEGGSLCNLGRAYESLGQYQCAIDFYLQALPIQCEVGNRLFEANSLGNLGNVYNSLGQYQRAIDFHQKSLEITRKIGDRNGEGGSLCNLGMAYDSLGQYQCAIDFYLQALSIQREVGNRQFEANSLGNLGNVYNSLGQYQRAIDLYQQQNEITREIGDRNGEADSLGNLGCAYDSLGQYQRAIDFHEQQNKITREIGDRNGEANSLGGLGNVYDSLGQYQRAIDFYQQWNDIAREIGDRSGEANSLGGLGNAYDSLGQYQHAIDFHQQCFEIMHEIGDRNGEANSLFNMASPLGKLDNHSQALLNLQQSKLIYEDLQLDDCVQECNEAILTAKRRSPPTIADQSPNESTIDWDEREKQANQKKTYTNAEIKAMNRQTLWFGVWFCVGLAIVFLVWKFRN